MAEMGVDVEKHHHEVAPSQHELGIKFDTLVKCADNMQIYKYVRAQRRRTPTARPRPSCRSRSRATTARACMCHQSIWKGGKPLFAGNGYADLSETALYYIGGIIKHAKALNAFTNPTTNSYKRLMPGFEAPVLLAYSSRNRSASCRIPFVAEPEGQARRGALPRSARPTPTSPIAAMLMAGLDGIENKIHPGDADGQEPLRPAAGGAEERADRLRLAARGAGSARRRPRLPEEGRRLHRRQHRGYIELQVGGGLRLRAHARTRSSSRCTTASDALSSSSQSWHFSQPRRVLPAGAFSLALHH